MTVVAWLKARGVELGASLCTAGILMAGLAVGVPFLRDRIAQTFLYSFCCVSAVLLRAILDLTARGAVRVARAVYVAAPLPVPTLGPSPAS
jgi:fucose permease